MPERAAASGKIRNGIKKAKFMKQIKNRHFEGERPLFGARDIILENVTIHAGESALKECSGVKAVNCRFEGKYPFWHNDGFTVKNCLFTEGARAAIWYSKNLLMLDTIVEAPKMFRERREARKRPPAERARNVLEMLRHRA